MPEIRRKSGLRPRPRPAPGAVTMRILRPVMLAVALSLAAAAAAPARDDGPIDRVPATEPVTPRTESDGMRGTAARRAARDAARIGMSAAGGGSSSEEAPRQRRRPSRHQHVASTGRMNSVLRWNSSAALAYRDLPRQTTAPSITRTLDHGPAAQCGRVTVYLSVEGRQIRFACLPKVDSPRALGQASSRCPGRCFAAPGAPAPVRFPCLVLRRQEAEPGDVSFVQAHDLRFDDIHRPRPCLFGPLRSFCRAPTGSAGSR